MSGNVLASTSLTPGVQASSQLTTTAETAVLTVLANTSVKVASSSLTNTTGTAVTVSVSVVKSGDTAGTTNRTLASYSLPANTTLETIPGLKDAVLGAGDKISMLAGTANAVNYCITGTVAA